LLLRLIGLTASLQAANRRAI